MPRRIAVVIDPWGYPYNGTVVSARRFVRALAENYEFHLLAIADGPGQDEYSRQHITPFKKLSIPGFNHLIDAMKVPLARPDRAQIRAVLEKADLLHVQFPFFVAYAAIGEARKLELPVLCSFHVQPENLLGNLGFQPKWLVRLLYRFFLATLYNRADEVIAPSEFAAKELKAHGLKAPVTVLSNGVPHNFFELKKIPVGESRSEHPAEVSPRAKHLVLTVGRLAEEKHQDVIIRAVAKSGLVDGIKLVVVGNGPQQARLIALADKLGVNHQIGTVSDEELLRLYAECNLFVHAGEVELEGMAVLEAMASACPVVIARAPGSATVELIEQAEALFEHGSVSQLQQRIDYWLSNPKAASRAGSHNREWAMSRSHEASARNLGVIYDRLLARRNVS